MDKNRKDVKLYFATDEKIAETSSKGNQEKWYDEASDRWFKLDQFGYEALSECADSAILKPTLRLILCIMKWRAFLLIIVRAQAVQAGIFLRKISR